MSSTTARLVIEGAIRLVKGSTYQATSSDIVNGQTALNDMLSSWSVMQVHVPSIVADSKVLSVGTGSYSIGSGGDINTARPVSILEGAYIRDSNGIDYPVSQVSREYYDSISHKSQSNRPTQFYYEPYYPLGIIYFNFVPATAETFYFSSLKHITEITDLTAALTVPPEFRRALRYNLAVELAPEYIDIKLPEIVTAIATESLGIVERLNHKLNESELDPLLVTTRVYSSADFNSGA